MGVWPAVSEPLQRTAGIDSGAGCLGQPGRLNAPVAAMVPYGDGYLMVGADGGIFDFSDQRFAGSLGSNHRPARSPRLPRSLADQRRHQEGPRRRDDIHDADLRTISAMNLTLFDAYCTIPSSRLGKNETGWGA